MSDPHGIMAATEEDAAGVKGSALVSAPGTLARFQGQTFI